MSIPDLRKAACCVHCYNYTVLFSQCLKYSKKVDMLEVCAKFIRQDEVEGILT